MKISIPPSCRKFSVNGNDINDCGKIFLNSNEMVSFVTSSKKEFDFTAKEWGFYATPSINGRLVEQGFRTAIVENTSGRIFIMVVDKDSMDLFEDYCIKEGQVVRQWLDTIKCS